MAQYASKPLALDETLRRIAVAQEKQAGIKPDLNGITMKQLQSLVQSKEAASLFSIGDQLLVPWKWGSYDLVLPFDVVHHYDGSDDDHPLRTNAAGASIPTMRLQSHFAIPQSCVFDEKEAFYVAQSNMAAGTYNFSIVTTTAWGGAGVSASVGTETYQFTLTSAVAKGSQFMWNGSYSAKPSTLTIYDNMGSTVKQTVSCTSGSSGTALGSMRQATASDAGFNNPQRACEGSNNYHTSTLKQWLNSTDASFKKVQQTIFDRPSGMDGKAGFMTGFDDEFLEVLAEVVNKEELHPFDGSSVIDSESDYFFPLSGHEHYFNNYLSEDEAGYTVDGVPNDYWKNIASANGRTSAWQGWQTYSELVTYDANSKATARYVWLRSASRYVGSAWHVGCVYASGAVDHANASNGYFSAPACEIG